MITISKALKNNPEGRTATIQAIAYTDAVGTAGIAAARQKYPTLIQACDDIADLGQDGSAAVYDMACAAFAEAANIETMAIATRIVDELIDY